MTLIPYRGDRVVVSWRNGGPRLPEGEPRAGESAEDAARRIGLEQAGIQDVTLSHLGHFRSRATSLSKTLAPGTISYQVLYAADVGGLADFPTDTAYERRIIRQRDLNELIRSSYVEARREYTDSLDPWLLERLKAGRA